VAAERGAVGTVVETTVAHRRALEGESVCVCVCVCVCVRVCACVFVCAAAIDELFSRGLQLRCAFCTYATEAALKERFLVLVPNNALAV